LNFFSSFQDIDISNKVELIEVKKSQSLNDIFPIKDIIEIKVTNYSGQYILNSKELLDVKTRIGISKYKGGLLVKPSHIFLKIKLKENKDAGNIYIVNDLINFDSGKNRKGEYFSGSFKLNKSINFDLFH
jgi:hypothetical protein